MADGFCDLPVLPTGYDFHHVGYATTSLDRERNFFACLGYCQEGQSFSDPLQGVAGLYYLNARAFDEFDVRLYTSLAGLTSSSSEARRQIEGGGLRLNDVAVKDVKATVGLSDFTDGVIKLSIGRKKHMLVKPV